MKLQQIFQDLSQSDIQTIEQSPGILIFLPMLYVAWSDSVLSADEVTSIEQKVQQQDWLSEEEKTFICQRLDPNHPPTPKQLHEWLHLIKKAAPHIPNASKKSLASLGLEITRISDQAQEAWQTDKTHDALSEIEDALGVITTEALEGLIPETPESAAPSTAYDSHGLDVEALAKLLAGKCAHIRQKILNDLQESAFEKKYYPDKDTYRAKVLEWCKILADRSYGSLSYPEAYGGANHMGEYFTVMEMMSYFDLSLVIKYGVQFGLFGGSVLALGTVKHHQKYLAQIGSLELPGCFAMTESGHGSNVRDIETTAHFDQATQEFIIHSPNDQARKDYIGNAALHGRMATVFAQLYLGSENHGVSAFLVPLRDDQGSLLPGISVEDCGEKLGLNGVDNGRIWFDQVRIPRENLLDRFAQVSSEGSYTSPISSDSKRFFTMLGTLVGGRIGIPRSALSAAKCGLTIAVRYALGRRQFGTPGQPEQLIMDYQTHQRRLMPLLANAYALDFALKHLTHQYIANSHENGREIEALAAGLKAYSTWNTTNTLQVCREACGGNGYLWVNRLAELKADTEIYTTFEGDNTVLMQLVAKSRLADFKQEFHDIKFFGLVKYIANQAATSLTEMNPIITRKSSVEHIRDSEFHMAAFLYREQHLLKRAGQRLKHRIDKGMNSFQAFNECQNHLVQLAHAYIERVILEQFQAIIESVGDAELQSALRRLCQLFAINLLHRHKGWYLENNYFESAKSKAIRQQLTELCAEVRLDARALVAAFGIPDKLLAAPIAT